MAPEQPEPSLVYSQPSLPPFIQGHDSIPSSFSHSFCFLFSSQPLVPTDKRKKRKKMKAGEGTLCLSLSLLAYFIGFILVVWPCLSLSYYFCLQLPGGGGTCTPTVSITHTHTRTNPRPMCTHLHI